MAEKKSSTPKRFRNFATIVYPESASSDWQEVLSSYHVPAFISPLHDKDTLPDGTTKKPHYHVMIMYEGVKTHEQVSEVISSLGGVGIEVISSLVGYSRYLCHMDEESKVKYSVDDVKCFAGADYYDCTHMAVDRHKALKDMRRYCRENQVTSLAEFCDYCDENRYDWSRLLNDCCMYPMDRYIKAISYEASKLKNIKKGS